MADVKRAYRSPRRREQAEATRKRILSAARQLFVAEGYGRTTIDVIAAEAGVAVQTVYAVFGAKGAMLIALLDELAAEADLPRLQQSLVAAAGDPRRQLRESISFTGRFYAAGFDLIDLARTVSGVEPDLARMWQAGEQRRYEANSRLVAEWARTGALRPGLSARAATDLLWAFSGPDAFRLLVKERGWSKRSRIERLSETLERMLLRERPPGAA
jgi:AcrR family transcriptional regulator